MTFAGFDKTNSVFGKVSFLLGDVVTMRGRLPTARFRAAYLASFAIFAAINALPFLASGELSFGIRFFGVTLAFLVVANIAIKRYRDTLPLSIEPLSSCRISSLAHTPADKGRPFAFCVFGHFFGMFLLLFLVYFEHDALLLQVILAVVFISGATAALATRYLWRAPSYPGLNQYGPNPHEAAA